MDKQYFRTNFISEEQYQNTIDATLNKIYEMMAACYGPYGSHILIETPQGAEATKDGLTILSRFIPDKSIAANVHRSIMSVANKQVEEIGDGSTTTILLLCRIYKRLREYIKEHNISPAQIQKDMEKVVNIINKAIKASTLTNNTDDAIYNALYTSVDANKELADIIMKMFKELDCTDPYILTELSTTTNHHYELVKGVEERANAIRPEVFFMHKSRKTIESPEIIVVNGRLDMSVERFTDLNKYAMDNEKDYVILCTGVNEDVLRTASAMAAANPAILNRITIMQIVKTTDNNSMLDMCAAIGATAIDEETTKQFNSKMKMINTIENNVGHCESALATEYSIRFSSPKANEDVMEDRLQTVIDTLEDMKKDPTSHNDVVSELEERKAFLSRKYAKLYVGGNSPQRKSINYELAKDGILQVQSCMKYGVTRGMNTFIPSIINQNIDDYDVESSVYDIMEIIRNAYEDITDTLIQNKYPNRENKINIPESLNIRDDDDTPVANSIGTDITILKYATDMAVLLATSKGFLSRQPEFDIL